MSSLTKPPYQVAFTFQNAKLELSGQSLETQLNSKAEAEHTHDLSDGTITDESNVLDNLTADCIKTSAGNATIDGTFNCKDVRIKINNTETSLADKIASLDGAQMTIQHLTFTSDPNVRVGYPVFYTGDIIGKNFTMSTVSSTDCVPIVKASGDWTTFAGICAEVDVSYYGRTRQIYNGKEHAFIRFATHGDFQMAVDDSSKYKVGDLITYDGNIINPDETMNYKTMMSIVGSVSAIVKNNSIAIFRI